MKSHLLFNCLNLTIETSEQCLKTDQRLQKNTRTMSLTLVGVFIINFEIISHILLKFDETTKTNNTYKNLQRIKNSVKF